MKLLLHLIRWDARRFRLLLAAWLAVIAAGAAADGMWPVMAREVATRELAGIAGGLLWLARGLLSLMLVALVVQAHPSVGTSAFWMTWPVPPLTLVATKLVVLAAAIIAAPVFAKVLLMAAYKVPAAQLVGVSAQTALLWALWTVVLMSAAAITPNLSRFALLLGGGVLAALVATAVAIAVTISRLDEAPMVSAGMPFSEPTSDLIWMLLTVAAGVGLLFVQFRTRNRVRSVPAGIAGVALAYFVSSAWAWPILAPAIETPPWAADPSMLRPSASTESFSLDPTMPGPASGRSSWRSMRAAVQIAGVAPGWAADIGVREATLQVNRQITLQGIAPNPATRLSAGGVSRFQRDVARSVLGVERLLDAVPDQDDRTTIMFARESDLRRLPPAAEGTYHGRLQIFLARYDIEAALPLREGVRHQRGAYRLAIDRVEPTPEGIMVLSRNSDAHSMFDRRAPVIFAFYLRNPEQREAITGREYELQQPARLLQFTPFAMGFSVERDSGFTARALALRFPPMYGRAESVALDTRWIESAELVIVRATPAGAVERQLTIANVRVSGG